MAGRVPSGGLVAMPGLDFFAVTVDARRHCRDVLLLTRDIHRLKERRSHSKRSQVCANSGAAAVCSIAQIMRDK